jgi:hypothetical protein
VSFQMKTVFTDKSNVESNFTDTQLNQS